MTRTLLAILVISTPIIATAGSAENIMACVNKTREFTGVALSEFEVVYHGNIIDLSTAKWNNAYCEVKLETVHNLKVNGTQVIFNRFAGKESHDLNKVLEGKTEIAITQLRSRISLLEQRMGQVSASLKLPKPNHAQLIKFVDEGIEKSTGAPRHETAPTPTLAPAPAKTALGSQSPSVSLPVPPPKTAGTYYVKESVLEVRLAPSEVGSVTNRIYRRQKVEVFETQNGWARISKYYDGASEGKNEQVARWVPANGLSTAQPAELPQPPTPNDSRIANNALPKVGQNNLTERDVQILYKGAMKFLNAGTCARVEDGDKSISKANTYWINCGGPNIFFTPADVQ